MHFVSARRFEQADRRRAIASVQFELRLYQGQPDRVEQSVERKTLRQFVDQRLGCAGLITSSQSISRRDLVSLFARQQERVSRHLADRTAVSETCVAFGLLQKRLRRRFFQIASLLRELERAIAKLIGVR